MQELTTVDGTSIWAGDGVHLTSNASRVAAQKLMQHIAMEGAGGEPANKRARLESVIPTQAAPRPPKPNIPPPPPTPKPVLTPLWLSGQLPAAQRGKGTGGHQRGPQTGERGNQGPRGGHTPYRSAWTASRKGRHQGRHQGRLSGRPRRPLGALVAPKKLSEKV